MTWALHTMSAVLLVTIPSLNTAFVTVTLKEMSSVYSPICEYNQINKKIKLEGICTLDSTEWYVVQFSYESWIG